MHGEIGPRTVPITNLQNTRVIISQSLFTTMHSLLVTGQTLVIYQEWSAM